MRQVQTIFCDDVRQEVGGKLTYVGTYAGSMLVSEFPAVLPKFCVAVTTVLDKLPTGHDMVLRIMRDDQVIAERTLGRDELEAAEQAAKSSISTPDGEAVHIINSLLMFVPFEIEAPCTLRVRALIGNEELRGVGLRILAMIEPAAGN